MKMQYLFTLGHGSDKFSIQSNIDKGRVYRNCKFHDLRGWRSYAKAWPYKS